MGETYQGDIINEINKGIFLGDNYQKLNEAYDQGLGFVTRQINSRVNNENEVYFTTFTESIGIPNNVINNVKYLLNFADINPMSFGSYNIGLFADRGDFIKEYREEKLVRKHIATIIQTGYINFEGFIAYPKNLNKSDYPYFLNAETINKYYFMPYNMISRELETIYIFITSTSLNDLNDDFIRNHLYILMTRATIKLNIYVSDKQLYDSFKQKVNNILALDENQNNDSINDLVNDIEV